jgi:serpin B
MKKIHWILILMMVALVAAQGCKKKLPEATPQEGPPKVEEPAAPQEPAPVPQPPIPIVEAPEADVKAASDSANGFALDFYKNGAIPKDGNCFLSPYSIAEVLTLAASGAAGATRDEMRKVLRLTLEDEQGLKAVAALRSSMRSTSVTLQSANRLWGRKDAVIKQPFQAAASKYFGAGLEPVDFKNDAEGARKKINGWIEQLTAGKIKDMVPEGSLSDMTFLLLTNAVYFKGDWDRQFDPKMTQPRPFYVPGKPATQVPMMLLPGKEFPYAAADGLKILEMPYKGGEISMVILLPEIGAETAPPAETPEEATKSQKELAAQASDIKKLEELEAKLTKENWDRWLAALQKTHIAVNLPRFTLRWKSMVKDALETMGMGEAFKETADFGGMSETKPWFITGVLHEAFVEVNEKGTEAAAATALAVEGAAHISVFNADHPFVFIIKENKTSTILFMGRVVDPTAG